MSETSKSTTSRREFLKNTGRVVAASTLAGVIVPHVHAAENNTINVALIGCGGRGTGAVANALSTQGGPVKLVAMADVFPDRLKGAVRNLKEFASQMDVPEDRKFIGFDAYKKAMDCLKTGDIAIFATPPVFRQVHFAYAIEKGLNVFMEKPLSVDGPGARRMFELAEESKKKNIKVAVGLMCRHCRARGELFDRIKSGQIGELITLRAYRMAEANCYCEPKPADKSDLLYQVQRFHSFLWSGGGIYSDFLIHNIDECCWMKDAWPIQAQATGGRHFRGNYVDQNFDNYSTEFTFPDGTKLMVYGRSINGCLGEFASYAHGSKGSAVISTAAHMPSKCRIYKGYNIAQADLAWAYPQPEPNPYQTEWDDLVDAVRHDKPYNEAARGTEASLVTAMGRMAAHTGQLVTRDQILNQAPGLSSDVDKFTMDSPAPLKADAEGRYPVPQPGTLKDREY